MAAKHAVILESMNYSKFGAMAQIVIMDAFTKSPAFVVHRKGETNEDLVRRVLKARPEVAGHIADHITAVAGLSVEAFVEAFDKSGASRMFNPRMWHAAAREVAEKLATA